MDNYQNETDEELVNYSLGGNDYSNAAQIEMMRRLKNEIKNFNESSNKHSKINIIITSILFFIAFIQTIIIIQNSVFNAWTQVILIIFLCISIWYLFNSLTKKFLKK